MIKIKERKLGRGGKKGYYGFSYPETGIIEIDPRLKSRTYLGTIIHEALHIFFPEMSEDKVNDMGNELTKLIWDKNFRRIQK